ncbi:MAG: PAS domain S-box protein [Candidatus Rokubacteria bacterium]|nr:PAS domain S-box protein [Candidatus Rokubacteria bacterium]
MPGSDATVVRVGGRIAAVLAVVIALGLPGTYLALSYQYQAGLVQTDAEINATILSELIVESPDTWQYQLVRIEDAISHRRVPGDPVRRRVVGPGNRLILETAIPAPRPVMVRSANLRDAGVVVGRTESVRSLRPLLIGAGAVGILGLVVSGGVFFFLRTLPLRALELSEARFRSVTQSAGDGIILADAAGRILSWNGGARAIFGWTEHDVLGTPVVRLIAEASREPFTARLLEGAGGAGTSAAWQSTVELEGLRQDGTEVPVELAVSTWKHRGETAYTLILRDISERRRAEAARAGLEAQLRQAQKMEAVGRLAGGVAHDFNNLLTVITGRSELLAARPSLDDGARRNVELIRQTAERAASLTQQLLAFSRKQVLTPMVLDLNATIESTGRLLRRLIGEQIEIRYSLDPGLGRVKADSAQIGQVIMNLAVNAGDAMPGGGTLTIETANAQIDAAFLDRHPEARIGPYVRLAVADTGHGMDRDTQARIFEPFFTTKEVGRGTGLGLATVYGVVKQSEGFIWVESEPGRGTRFEIFLPRVEEVVQPKTPVPAEAQRTSGAETILLVEDEEPLLDLGREILRAAGYAVLAARDGAQALEISEAHAGPIDLLLTDVVMPRMSGRALAEQLTRLRPGMRVLYMSGYTHDTPGLQGVLEPGTALLQKPFSPPGLAAKVREVLDTEP